MPGSRSRRLSVLLAAAAVLVTPLGGCGKKGPPLPPQIRIADTTRDLSVVQLGTEAVITWSYPSMTSAGGPLPDLESIELWRTTMPASQEPAGTTPQDRAMRHQLISNRGELIADLGPDELAQITRGPLLSYRDDLRAWRGDHADDSQLVVWYAVRSICCRKRISEYSNIARLLPQLPPDPPTVLEATPSEAGIRLEWQVEEGIAAIVERTSDGVDWQRAAAEPIRGDEWLDTGAALETTWSYRLRSVREVEGGGRVIGEPSVVVRVEHPDVYPPPIPADLVCLPEAGRVRVRWRIVDGADGYRIYRRLDRGEPQLLIEGHRQNVFEDVDPPLGSLTYGVRAVDSAGNQSEPATCTTVIGSDP